MQILITGAASGLGREFATRYARNPQHHVIAVDRHPLPPELAGRPNIKAVTMDLISELSPSERSAFLPEGGLDLLIHSAGIRGLVPAVELEHADNVAMCETMAVMDVETMTRTLQINSVATFALIKSLVPSLRKSKDSKVVIMSSRMGSVGNNTSGGGYAYRASKAAVNAIVKSFSIDVPEVTFILCHPGRVETGLVLIKEPGAIPVSVSVDGLIPLIDQWTSADSGRFVDRFGEEIIW